MSSKSTAQLFSELACAKPANPDRVEELDEGVDDVLLDVGHDEGELGEALGEAQEHGAQE